MCTTNFLKTSRPSFFLVVYFASCVYTVLMMYQGTEQLSSGIFLCLLVYYVSGSQNGLGLFMKKVKFISTTLTRITERNNYNTQETEVLEEIVYRLLAQDLHQFKNINILEEINNLYSSSCLFHLKNHNLKVILSTMHTKFEVEKIENKKADCSCVSKILSLEQSLLTNERVNVETIQRVECVLLLLTCYCCCVCIICLLHKVAIFCRKDTGSCFKSEEKLICNSDKST